MRVCHFIGTKLAGQYFKNLAREMPAQGISLSYASLLEEEKPAWLNEYADVNFINLRAKSRLDYPAAIFRLAKFLRKEKIDILQIHLFDGGLVGIPAARLASVGKIIYMRHHSDLIHTIGKSHHIVLDRWMARAADKVVAVSQAVKDFMVERDFIAADKIEVVYLGFDFEKLAVRGKEIERVRKEFDLENKFVVGCIASFQKVKGHKFLLQAFSAVKNVIPEARLLLLGGGDRTEIVLLVKNFELTDRVVFAGYRDDVPACIKAMDLVVHPSLSEAFSQVIIETMGIGTALIATDVGGAREVIKNGENALLISPQNSNEIADSILKLYKEPTLRRDIAANGKKSVRKNFTVQRMVGEYLNLYRLLLGEKV